MHQHRAAALARLDGAHHAGRARPDDNDIDQSKSTAPEPGRLYSAGRAA